MGHSFSACTCIWAMALGIGMSGSMSREVLAAGAETCTTSVNLSLNGAHLAIVLTMDLETLLARLDRLGGRGRSTPLTSEPLNDAVVRREADLLRQVSLQLDDRPAQVRLDAVSVVEKSGAADEPVFPRVTVRLSAVVPNGVRNIRWATALASAAYPLTIHQGPSVTSETIVGADLSRPILVAGTQSPGANQHVWAWFVPALFSVLIALRLRERRSWPVGTRRNG